MPLTEVPQELSITLFDLGNRLYKNDFFNESLDQLSVKTFHVELVSKNGDRLSEKLIQGD